MEMGGEGGGGGLTVRVTGAKRSVTPEDGQVSSTASNGKSNF